VNDEVGMQQMGGSNNQTIGGQQQANDGGPQQGQSWLQTMQNTRVPPPFCESHQVRCHEFTVRKKNANFGRKFFTCPADRSCFFMWGSEWRSTFQNARPPTSAVVTHKGRRYIVCESDDSLKHTIQLELFAKKSMNDERVLAHLPCNDKVRARVLNRISRLAGYHTEGHKGLSVSFPSTQIDILTNTIKSIDTNFAVEPVPTKIRNILKFATVFDEKDESHMDWNRLPDKLRNSLRPFQRVGVMFGVKKDGVCLIADEMGLGKTIQSIAIAYYFKETWPLLIICPSSLRMNWSAEFELWLMPHIRPSDINLIQKSRDLKADISQFKVTIISYDLATRNIEQLTAQQFKFVIADESHYLKAETSQRTKCITPLMKSATRKILITGTPALSRPKELFPQIDALLEVFLNSYEYKKRYCNAVMGQFGLDDNGSSNLKELNYFLKKTVMIRREKKHVLTELPEKLRVQLTVEVSTQNRKNLDSLMNKVEKNDTKKNLARSFEELDQVSMQKNRDWMKMFNRTAEAKIPAVTHYVSDRLKNTDDKFLIFGHHKVMLDAIEEVAKKVLKKGNYIRIDGSTPNHQRQGLVDKFRDEEKCRIAILSIQAAGTGLNFTPCSQVVFAELFWTPGALKQAEDRVHRLNQRSDVHITYIIGRHTIDEKIWPLILRKLEVLSKSLDMQEEDKEQWKKKKKWGKTSRVIEMLEQRNIEKKIQEEDEMRSLAKEHEELHEHNFVSKIKEIEKRKKERKTHQMSTLLDIASLLDQHVYLEEGDIPPPNQRGEIQISSPPISHSHIQSTISDDLSLLSEDLTQVSHTTKPASKKRKRETNLAPKEPVNKKKRTSKEDEQVLIISSSAQPVKQKRELISTTKSATKGTVPTRTNSLLQKKPIKQKPLTLDDMFNKPAVQQTSDESNKYDKLKDVDDDDIIVDTDVLLSVEQGSAASTQPQTENAEIDPNMEALIDTLVYKPPTRRTSTGRFFHSPTKSQEMTPSLQQREQQSTAPQASQQAPVPRVHMEDDVLDFL